MYKRFISVCLLALLVGCDTGQQAGLKKVEQRLESSEQTIATLKAASDKTTQQLSDVNTRLDSMDRSLSSVQSGVNKMAAERIDAEAIESSIAEAQDLKSAISTLEKELAEMRQDVDRELASVKASVDSVDPAATDAMNDATPVEKAAREKRPEKRDRNKFSTTMFSWNVESEGSDPRVIARQLAEFNRYDVYGLSEVLPQAAAAFHDAVGGGYESLVTRSGNNDRLQLIINTRKYELLRRLELDEINFENRYRSPLVAHLQDRATGQQLYVMVNHLARGREEIREKQALQLVEWAREQNLPVVAIGDYNFDYEFTSRKGNRGFVNMMRDGIWKWIEPVELIDTNWYDNPANPDGLPDYPNSMLDFAFVAGSATQWQAECRIIVRPNDFPDDETTSDHRPFELYLEHP